MLLRKSVEGAIEISQKIKIYNAFDAGTINHFNAALREVKRHEFLDSTKHEVVMLIQTIRIIDPSEFEAETETLSFLDRLFYNRWSGPLFSFQTIFSSKDLLEKKYVFDNYMILENVLRKIKNSY